MTVWVSKQFSPFIFCAEWKCLVTPDCFWKERKHDRFISRSFEREDVWSEEKLFTCDTLVSLVWYTVVFTGLTVQFVHDTLHESNFASFRVVIDRDKSARNSESVKVSAFHSWKPISSLTIHLTHCFVLWFKEKKRRGTCRQKFCHNTSLCNRERMGMTWYTHDNVSDSNTVWNHSFSGSIL